MNVLNHFALATLMVTFSSLPREITISFFLMLRENKISANFRHLNHH